LTVLFRHVFVVPKNETFRYEYDFIFRVKSGMFDKWLFKEEKRHLRAIFMKNALKPKRNIKKQDDFSQKVTFLA